MTKKEIENIMDTELLKSIKKAKAFIVQKELSVIEVKLLMFDMYNDIPNLDSYLSLVNLVYNNLWKYINNNNQKDIDYILKKLKSNERIGEYKSYPSNLVTYAILHKHYKPLISFKEWKELYLYPINPITI